MDTNNRDDRFRFSTIMKAWEINFSANMGDTAKQREGVLRLYMKALEAFSIDEIEVAAQKILLTRKYKQLPTIAEIVEAIRGPEPSIEASAVVAANAVIEALRSYNPSTMITPDFNGDSITQHLMSRIWPFHNWSRSVKTDALTWWKKDFVEAYKAHAQTGGQKLITGPAQLTKLAKPLFKPLYPKKRRLPDSDQSGRKAR